MAEEDGDLLVSPTPVSPSTCAGTNSFEVGADQDPEEAGIIRSVYASFAASDEETIGKMLIEISKSEEGEENSLVV